MEWSMSVKRMRRWWRRFLPLMVLGMVASCAEGAPEQAASPEDDDADVDTLTPGFTENAVYPDDAWRTVEGAFLPESAHPYANSRTLNWTIEAPSCAQAIRVHFERINLRSGDTLTLYKADGRRVQRITGNQERFISEPIESTSVKLTLRTNASGQGWGFKVSRVEIVEQPPVCSRQAWRACNQDQVTLFSVTPLCECPRQPACQPLGEWGAQFGAGGGFTGGYQGKLIDGNGQIFSIRQPTATAPQERVLIGHASQERLHNVAQEVHAMNFWNTTLPSGSANMTVMFRSWQHDSSAQATWPINAQPESMDNAVTLFNKAATCGSDPADAICARGFTCVEGACVEAPRCSCAEIYQPVCGIHDNTYASACQASCAGEEVKHTGECGIAGDNCGTTRDLVCAQGFRCEYPGESAEPSYENQAGACVTASNEGPGCVCPAVFLPVCGVDGHTYSNACSAGCAQVSVAHQGECGVTGDRCGGREGVQCQTGYHCAFEEAPGTADHVGTCQVDAPTCACTREYRPQCGVDGKTYGNPCTLGCSGVALAHEGECGIAGDACGGIRGLACQDGLRCRYGEATYEPPYPDAMGACVPAVGYCDLPVECGMTVRLSCPATWYCENHACRYECNAPTETWQTENVRFESAHPYRNSQRQGWTATGEAGTTAVRVVFESFDLEEGYDFVTLYDEGWNEVARYSGNLGAFTTAEVPGRIARIVFTTDSSVVKSGFVGTGVEFKRPN